MCVDASSMSKYFSDTKSACAEFEEYQNLSFTNILSMLENLPVAMEMTAAEFLGERGNDTTTSHDNSWESIGLDRIGMEGLSQRIPHYVNIARKNDSARDGLVSFLCRKVVLLEQKLTESTANIKVYSNDDTP
jgi:hypothetical protein